MDGCTATVVIVSTSVVSVTMDVATVLRIVLTAVEFPVIDEGTSPGCRRSSSRRPMDSRTGAPTQVSGTNHSSERNQRRRRYRRIVSPFPVTVVLTYPVTIPLGELGPRDGHRAAAAGELGNLPLQASAVVGDLMRRL